MNQPHFITKACPKCAYGVHVVPQVGVGVCPQCHTQVSLSAAEAPAGVVPPQASVPHLASTPSTPSMPSAKDVLKNPYGAIGGFFSRFGKVGIVMGMVATGLLATGAYYVKSNYLGTGKGTVGYAALGLDRDAPDADKMITSVESHAKRWRKDAVFWSVNFQAVSAEGTVDPTKGATVTYISPTAVQSHLKKTRGNSIKKFSFGQVDVSHKRKWGATEPWKGVTAPPVPTCSIGQLARQLQEAGLGAKETFRVSYDPQWGYKWSVDADDKALAGDYSIENCAKIES